ncbi:MMPL family transporter [Actinoplanes couchii]|uniref:Exporter n=1 Tax=Actinoplanes couchii TaxID=403638 RepID=A0ABQ3X0L9_9ACTN|nr:MMPL family transporter [Actinoplanes couchii]MDR6316471.1 RND superfamily putative drug exporter [Actinoplanes couchii]GID52086.1 exporter [Actinoplanes couchii]
MLAERPPEALGEKAPELPGVRARAHVPEDTGATTRVFGWSVRHPGKAVAAWILLVAVSVAAGSLSFGAGARNVDPGEAGTATRALMAQDGFNPVRESVLIQPGEGNGGSAGFRENPALRSAVRDLVRALKGTSGAVTGIGSPLGGDRPDLVSADGRSALVTFQIAGTAEQIRPHFRAAVAAVDATAAAHPGVRVVQAGDRSLATAVDDSIKDDFRTSHLLALPISLVLLLVVFGSAVAASVPLVLTATAVLATFGLLRVVDHWLPINSAVNAMVLLIGMAVGIDYCLFHLRRHREERLAGHDVGAALRITARTSGRVVLASGLTVMLCLSGLLLTGIGVFRGLAVGTILVVGLTVAGSVSVLPALLSVLGRRVDSLRLPWLGRQRTEAGESRVWAVVVRAVVRRPLITGGVSVLALLVLAAPAIGMRPQDPAVIDSLPRTVPVVDAAIRMQDPFPGAAAPSQVVIWKPDGGEAGTPAVRDAIAALTAEAERPGGLLGGPVAVAEVGNALVVRVPLAGSGTDEISVRALKDLRERVLPAAFSAVDGPARPGGDVRYAVGGRTATAHDFADRMSGRAPWVFAFVLALAFVLLVVMFRSWTVPVVSILLNLLSIGAAYGVLTWVFQEGHLAGAIGFTPYGGVVGWLPLFMFVMLFGLSMDYHIFILSRIRERWAGGAPSRHAIVDGVARSAGVVTSAAVLMTAVFLVFVVLSAIEYKMLGVGMAVAVVIDATVVRGVLLPAFMALLGRHAWETPRWLGRPGEKTSR